MIRDYGWLGQRERGSRIATRFMIWLALSVGRPAARALLYPICGYYLIFSRQASRAIRPYLIRALGTSDRLARLISAISLFRIDAP